MSYAELVDALLEVGETDTLKMLGCGAYRDDRTLPINNLSLAERRVIISGAGIKTPLGEVDTQNLLVRYILEQEYNERKGSPERAARVHRQMRVYMGSHGVNFLRENEEDTDMTEATETTAVAEPTEGKVKKFRKPAAVKKAEKATAKAAAKKGAKAPKAEKPAKAAKAAKAEKPAKAEGTPRARFGEDTVFAHQRAMKADEKILGSNKRGSAIAEFIKEKGTVTQAAILKAIPKLTETTQPPEKIWAFYRPQLLAMGLVKAKPATA